MRSSQSSSGILTGIGEVKSAPVTMTLENKMKCIIAMKIKKIFGDDPSLVQDLQRYVEQLNDLNKLSAISQSLDAIVENLGILIKVNVRVIGSSSWPLVDVFFLFLQKMHAITKDDFGGKHDPELFRIAKVFYTNHVSELACEYNLGPLKKSFLCQVMAAPDPELKELFYQLGVNCNLTWEEYGNTPLLFLIANAYNTEAEYLLVLADKYPQNILDVNVRSTLFGTSALHLVVAKGYRDRSFHNESLTVSNLALAEKLIQHGANVNLSIEKKDDIADGMTALHLAAARKDMEFCKLLIEHGADLHIKAAKGQAPLDLLFMSDKDAKHLISKCTGDMSCYRQFQPEDASPDKLKLVLTASFEEIRATSLQKKLKLSAS